MLAWLGIVVRDFLLPTVLWSVIWTVAAIGLGAVSGRLCMRRLRRSAGTPPHGGLVWGGRLWIIVVLGLVPAVTAVVQAVPFAIERALAVAIDRGSPKLIDWTIDTAGGYTAAALGIADDQTVVDLAPLSQRLAALHAEVETSRPSGSIDRLKRIAHLIFLRGLQDAITSLSGGQDRMRWADLVRVARTQMNTHAGTLFAAPRLALLAAAWANVFTAVLVIGGCHAITWAIFLVAFRATPSR